MSTLTREDILGMTNDIEIREITVPESIPGWGGKSLHIKQLTRGQQDRYLRRQYGEINMKQDRSAKNQDIKGLNFFGHDAWLFVQGVCDEQGKAYFTDADLAKLEARNGEAIGWVASQIVEFSGMSAEVKVARGEKSAEEAAAEELKN